jgi:hypothetical protein
MVNKDREDFGHKVLYCIMKGYINLHNFKMAKKIVGT